MQKARVLVIGDCMLDRFVYGHVERISPESPVPVLNIGREELMCGGAGNALANLAGLGAQGHLLSVIGPDEAGGTLKSLIQDMKYDASGLIEEEGRSTTEKTRFLAGHQQLLRTDYEQCQAMSEKTQAEFLEHAEAAMAKTDVVLISDYGKGLLTKALIRVLIGAAQKRDLPVLIDPKGQDFSIYSGATAITPNKKELSEATGGMPVETNEDIENAAQKLIEACDIHVVIATRSKQGISVIERDKPPIHIDSAGHIEVFDVSGAGDTVIATIAAYMAAGGTLVDATSLANMAGHIVVTKVGTAPIRYDELFKAAQDSNVIKPGVNSDFLDADEAKECVQRWRARGLRVGFTNGCFDILHAGHVQYLQESRKYCDRLVVGLNRDSSVRILKGEDRPVHDELSRAAVLRALACVDGVVLFGAEQSGDDNTAIALIESLKPDVYFKGGDYGINDIPEAPSVQAYGGEVKVMSELHGQSTTKSIDKIKQDAA